MLLTADDKIESARERNVLGLIESVAQGSRSTVRELFGRRGYRHVSRARQEAYFRLADEYGWSTASIGELFGRDHSTVAHGIASHRSRCGISGGTNARPRDAG